MDILNSIEITEIIKQSQYTGLIVFLIAFLESLLLVGFFFPGSIALIALGGLISTGYLELWPTLFWAITGAIIGDNLSFWIGVYFQKPLKASSLYKSHLESFHKGELFFHKYGVYGVVLGRFIGPIRAVIPAIAGSLGMSGQTFFIVNILSAIVWAPVYIVPGIFMGKFYSVLERYVHLEFLVIFIISLYTWICYWIIKKFRQRNKYISVILLVLTILLSLAFTLITYQG